MKDRIIPSEVGDIHVPRSKIPFDLNIKFMPDTPFEIDSNQNDYGVSTTETGIQAPKPSFLQTAGAEAYAFNTTAQLAHAGFEKYKQQLDYDLDLPPSADWKPTSQPEMFYDVRPQYMSALMNARGPKELQYIHDRIMEEQQHDDNLENGSTFAKIIGGLAGALTDPISYIPIAGWAKYAKFAPTILKSAARAFPGLAAAGTIQSAAKELDKVNGNLHDFVIDAGINTVVATAVFGALPGLSLALDKMELFNLKDLFKSTIKGIDFNFELNDKGEIAGVKAFDTTGNLSAAEVSYAQEMANSSFHKSGWFKIPYVGDATLKLKSLPFVGSPLLQMINSPYETVRAFIDRAADHSIITKGIAEGGVKPVSFEFLMKKEFASIRSISTQMNALHLERNGIDINIRPVGDITRVGLGLYNKSLKLLGKDLEKTGYVSRDDFHDEVQRVLFTKEPSQHAAVNEAASIMRNKIDTTYKAYLKAYNLPEDILDPKTAAGYLMRVYDTPYMNINKDKWVSVVSNWLKDSDAFIIDKMQPIHDLKNQIKAFEAANTEAVKELGRREAEMNTGTELVPFTTEVARPIKTYQVKGREQLTSQQKQIPGGQQKGIARDATMTLADMRQKLKFMKESLQNELRANPEYKLHVDNINALSANEAAELRQILQPANNIKKQIEQQKSLISELKEKRSRKLSAAKKSETIEKAKPKAEKYVNIDEEVNKAEDQLNELNRQLQDEEYNLYQRAREGDINPRLYYPQTHQFKDINDRLKFRAIYNNHIERENHAKAYFDTIMHQTPEDTIADVMGKVTGNGNENPLKARTLLLPDELLYNNNFMTKDLMAKLSNYVMYLSRRTNLKNVFKDVTHDGGIEPLIEKLNDEFKTKRAPWDTRKAKINEELKANNVTDRKSLEEESKELDKKIQDETKRFNHAKEQLNKSYNKMMGIRQRSSGDHLARSAIMSMTALTNLHFLPATQIADLGSIGLQHGVWPFIRDAVYPVIESLGGILKTEDSEALRKSAPSVHLALQDQLGGYGDKNWSMESQPYLNLGRWVGGIEKMAHFSANADLTTYIDNGLQRLAGATVQSEFMRILHAFMDKSITPKESEYLRKYGIDPQKWAERMVNAYKESNGYKTKLGGYQSKFWEWQDMEAANEFSDAVFRGIQNTIINRGMFDSPFWADNTLGLIFHTFTGWGYAAVNRYLIPNLQRPDAEKILGVLLSLGFGSLVSPIRRAVRGEDAYPDTMSDGQRFWETINDSNATSSLANVLSWANLLSGDKLLGDLKNDKYRNRMWIGAFGPVINTANRMGNIFMALSSGEMNQKDAEQMARMLPVFGSTWGYEMSKMMIDNLGLPPTRQAAANE